MKPIQFETSHRGTNEPVDDSNTGSGFSECGVEGPLGENGANTVRQDVERAMQYLKFTSLKPAVLLAREWHVRGIPFAFKHQALYEEVAAAFHCFLVRVNKEEAGGIQHLLFAARIRGLKDAEYIACIDEAAAPVALLDAD